MATNYIDPLNLEYIFKNLLAGSTDIVMVAVMLLTSILCGVFNITLGGYLIFLSLASILLYGLFGEGLFIFFLIILSLIIFFTIGRLVKN